MVGGRHRHDGSVERAPTIAAPSVTAVLSSHRLANDVLLGSLGFPTPPPDSLVMMKMFLSGPPNAVTPPEGTTSCPTA